MSYTDFQVGQKIDEENQEANNQDFQPAIPVDQSERDNMGTLQCTETNPEGESPQPHSSSSSTDPQPSATESNMSYSSQATTTPSANITHSENIAGTSKNTNSDRVQDITDTPIPLSDNREVGKVRETAQTQASTVEVHTENIADTANSTLDTDTAETERITESAKTTHTAIIATELVDHTSAESAADSNAVEAASAPEIYSSTSDSDPDSYSGSDTLSSGTESESYASAQSMSGPESLQPSAIVAYESSEIISDTKPSKMANDIAPAEAIAEGVSDTISAVSVAQTVSTGARVDTLSADSVSTDTVSADSVSTDTVSADSTNDTELTDTTDQAVSANAIDVYADTATVTIPAENTTVTPETATVTVSAEIAAPVETATVTVPDKTATVTAPEIAAPARTATATVPAETATATVPAEIIATPAETATATVPAEIIAALAETATATVSAETATATVLAETATVTVPAEIIAAPAEIATVTVPAETATVIAPAEIIAAPAETATVTVPAETATVTAPAEISAAPAETATVTVPAETATVTAPAEIIAVPAETATATVSAEAATIIAPTEINAAPAEAATVTVPAETATVTAPAEIIAVPAETAAVTVPAETTAVLPGNASTAVPAENATVPAEIISTAVSATATMPVPSHKMRRNANLNLPAANNVEGIASLSHPTSAINTAPVRVTATTAASVTEAEVEAAAINILTGASLEGYAYGSADSASSSAQSNTNATAKAERPAGQGVRSRTDNSVRPRQYNGARPRPNTRMSNRSGTSAQVDSQRRSDTRTRRKRNTTRTVSQEDIREMKKAAQVFKFKVENIAKERRLKLGKVKAALSDVHRALATCQNRLRNRTFNTSHCENDLDRAAQTVQTSLEKIRQCLNSNSGPSTELADRDDVYGVMNQAAGIAANLRKEEAQQEICLDALPQVTHRAKAELGGVRAAEHSEAGLMENIATTNAQNVTSQSTTNVDGTRENILVTNAEKSDNPPPARSNDESLSRDREEPSDSSTTSSILPSFVIDTQKVPRIKFQGKRFQYNQNYSIINMKITPGRPGQNTKISIYENVRGFYPSNRARWNQNDFNGRNSGRGPRNTPFPRQNRWRFDRAGTTRRASASSEYSHTSHRTPSLGDSNALLQGTNSHMGSHMGSHNFFGVNIEAPDFGRKFFHYIHALYLLSHPEYLQFVQNNWSYTQQGHSAAQTLQYHNPPNPCQPQEKRAQIVEMSPNENDHESNAGLCAGQTVHHSGMSTSSGDGNASRTCWDFDASEDSKEVSVENCLKTLTLEVCRLQRYCATPPGSIEVFNREIKRIQEFSYRENLEDSEEADIEKLVGKLDQGQESTAPCSGTEQDQCKDDKQIAAYSETELSKDARSSDASSSNHSPHQSASTQQAADSDSSHNRQISDNCDSAQLDRSGGRPNFIPRNRHIRQDSGNAYHGAERKKTFRGYNVDVDFSSSLQRWPGKRKTRYCQQNNRESLTDHHSNYNRPWPPKNPYLDMEDNFQNPGNGEPYFPGRKSSVWRLAVALPQMADDKYLSNLNALVVLEKEGLLLALDLRNKYVKQYVMSEKEKEEPQFIRSGHASLLDTQPLFMCKLNENMVVVACKDRKMAVLKCVRYRNHPEYLLSINCSRQYAGLAYIRDNVLACSSFSRRCVDIVHVKEEIETRTIVNTHDYGPETLCYLPEIGQIVFLERSETGGLRLVGVTETQEIKFREPFDPSVENSWNIARYQNNIVACCKTTNQFKLLTPDGKYLAEFNFTEGDIDRPFGLYFDTKGRFYVANEGTQNNGVSPFRKPDIKAFVMR